jgi:hypothetical protein
MKGFRAAAALDLFIVLVGTVASMVQALWVRPNVGVKQRELCVPTLFVVVSLATVGLAALIVALVAKASVEEVPLLLLLPRVLEEWVTSSPTPCSISSFPIGIPSTPMLRSSLLPIVTLLLERRETQLKRHKKLLRFVLT